MKKIDGKEHWALNNMNMALLGLGHVINSDWQR